MMDKTMMEGCKCRQFREGLYEFSADCPIHCTEAYMAARIAELEAALRNIHDAAEKATWVSTTTRVQFYQIAADAEQALSGAEEEA